MIRPYVFCTILAVGLAGCGQVAVPRPQARLDLAAQVVRGERPSEPKEACWANDATPAVIETVTNQIAESASAESDAGYRVEIQQEIVQPREKIWFRAPCPEALSPEVISTLQRALAARGLFAGDTSGSFDPATRAAIRAYQGPLGLNSDRLSLAAAQELGVVPADFAQPIAQ